jgi:hypothetical protein
VSSVLEAASGNECHYFATGDVSWFYLELASRWIWKLKRADVHEKPRMKIQARKLMFTIIWSAQGFHVVNSRPDGTTMSSANF